MSDPVYNKLSFNGYRLVLQRVPGQEFSSNMMNCNTIEDAICDYAAIKSMLGESVELGYCPSPEEFAFASNRQFESVNRGDTKLIRIEDNSGTVIWKIDE